MARLNLRPFLPLFLAAAGCLEVADPADPLADADLAGDGDADPGEPASGDPAGEDPAAPAEDETSYENVTEEDFPLLRRDLYCEALWACDPDAACDPSLSQWATGACEGFDAQDAAACLNEADDRLFGMSESPTDSECVAAMNPSACELVFFEDESLPGCAPQEEEGRPIRDQGRVLLAEIVDGNAWCQADCEEAHEVAARVWTRAAKSEHGSIPAFSRLSQELMAHAAPPELIVRCHQAALDEIAHARACLAMARRYGAGDIDLGALPMPTPRIPTLTDLALEALEEGCFGEGVAAMRARLASQRCSGEVSDTLRLIADDETRHAQLAWATLDWLLTKDSSLAPKLLAHLERLRGQLPTINPASDEPDLQRYGLLRAEQRAALSHAVLDQIIAPTLGCLVRKHSSTSSRVAA